MPQGGALPCEFATSLAKGIGRTHFRCSQYINRFHKRSGHLWQGRFYSCALDDRHLLVAMKYVEFNPVRAQTGRPLGSDGFVSKLETRLGRRVRPLPVGRPRKKQTRSGTTRRGRG